MPTLRSLNARIFNSPDGKAGGIGLVFDCPCKRCQEGDPGPVVPRVMLVFRNPIGRSLAVGARYENEYVRLWDREGGDTIDDITIYPSVDLDYHFHAWVRNGAVQILCD